MKRIQLSFVLVSLSVLTYAQNKTLSVGTATPNPNAALHVESPTSNQGAIFPRLTTAQRTAMAGVLGTADAGLMLFDSTLNALFLWNGSGWQNAAGLSLPYEGTVTTPTGTNDLFALKYNNAETKRVLRVENQNQSNPGSAVSISNNGHGLGLYVQNINDTASASTVYIANNSNNTVIPGPAGIYSEATGLGGTPGSFRIINPSSDRNVIFAETLGTGMPLSAWQSGPNGNAGYFWVRNAGNNGSSVYARTDGTGTAINALTTGSGYAGSFEITNAGNTNAAVLVQTDGVGPAIQASHSNGGLAVDMISGGIRLSVLTINTLPTTVTEKVGVIHITASSGNLTLSTAGRIEGETITISAPTASPTVSILGLGSGGSLQVNLNYNSVKTFIFIGGIWVADGMYAP